jgi:hypothetical protein
MRLAPAWQARNQPATGEGVRGRHAQRALLIALSQRGHCGRECVQPVSQHREQALARTRQRQRTGTTPEQPVPAELFKKPDLMTDRRRRHTELRCRALEAEVTRGGFERP